MIKYNINIDPFDDLMRIIARVKLFDIRFWILENFLYKKSLIFSNKSMINAFSYLIPKPYT